LYIILLALNVFGPRKAVWTEEILAIDDRRDLEEANDRLFSDLEVRIGDGIEDGIRLYDILTEGLKSHIRSLIWPVESSAIENR
jgi:hypothetical protein